MFAYPDETNGGIDGAETIHAGRFGAVFRCRPRLPRASRSVDLLQPTQRGANLSGAESQNRQRNEAAEVPERTRMPETLHEIVTTLAQGNTVHRVLAYGRPIAEL